MLQTILLILFLTQNSLQTHSLNQDGLYLHQLTRTLDDTTQFFSNWNPNDSTPCNWTGVTCSQHSPGSVTSLDFTDSNLDGPFPLILCNLPYLTTLVFYNNYINSTLPSQISTCSSLAHLDLAQNLITGEIPESLSEIQNLTYLDLSANNFFGEVPDNFGKFKKLEIISLTENLLNGSFPNVLLNVTTLKQLNLSFNSFFPTRLGVEIGSVADLEILYVANCSLIGEIPDVLDGLKRLQIFDVSGNELTGSIPSSFTKLTSLVQGEFYGNSLSGELPKFGWKEMSSLRYFDASMNNLTGTIPDELTQLPLVSLNLYQNNLVGSIPEYIADSPNLTELKLFSNRLTGELPSQLGVNSPLYLIDVSYNSLTGTIPHNICAKGELTELLLIDDLLSGGIPASLSECRSLIRVRLSKNNFSGEVPDGFWSLPHTSLLELSDNSISGVIPISIVSATNLSQLLISNNAFSGEIPEEIGLLDKLVRFMADNNKFSGPLPGNIVRSDNLGVLHLNNNQLSGEIPSGIKNLVKLNDLNLANNQFSGFIPGEFGDLPLNYLDLSNNRFSGQIPNELENLKLNSFNLSNNRLTGNLPPLFAKEIYSSSFFGNPGLCVDTSGLCDGKNQSKKIGHFRILLLIFILTVIILLLGGVWYYWKFKRAKKLIGKSKWTLTSFHKLGFSEYEILDCLNDDNVIGTGASGKVYKAILSNGETVAVKKLHSPSKKVGKRVDVDSEKGTGRDNGFEAEVETLGKIRHKNIVRLWCCCKTNECELLVYEYMINGSLGDFLHGPKSGLLDWPTRVRIGLDAAEGLSYLHHDCVPPIVHRDIKSNNILLDGDFKAKVADFGVAKVVGETGVESESMSVIAGSCGYIAPEYAYTLRVNEKCDTYSFGVVILELLTGKRPVDPDYGEKDLVKWVCTTMDQKGVDHVLDPKLDSYFKEQMCKVLNIGLLCTNPLPVNRPSMRRVVKMLLEISDENRSKSVFKDGKLTACCEEGASDHRSVA